MEKLIVESKYGVTPNEVLNHKGLSWKAKGLYGYIQSKPNDWDFAIERMEASDGKDSTRSGIQELEKFGYLTREKIRKENGLYEIVYTLYATPNHGGKPATVTVPTMAENPPSENPPSENPPSNKERGTKQEIQRNIYIKEAEEFIKTTDSVTASILKRLMSLGYIPNEPVANFKRWCTSLGDLHSITPGQLDDINKEWYVYWLGRNDKKIKNFKTTFSNSPLLPKNATKWKKN